MKPPKRTTLTDVPGRRYQRTRVIEVRTWTEAERWLIRWRKPIVAFGPEGSITCWRTDSGKLILDFQRFRRSISRLEPKKIKEVRPWLKEWFPRLKTARTEGGDGT
jgi:hypothetical protein